MRNPTKIWLLTAVVLLLGVGIWRWSQPKEPEYAGRTVSEWFYAIGSGDDDPGFLAIREMGADAVPFLLQQFRWSRSRFHEKTVDWANRYLHAKFMPDDKRWFRVCLCLMHLGSKAEAAVPEIIELSKDPKRENRDNAIRLLGAIHRRPEITIPVLQGFIQGKDFILRERALIAIGDMGSLGKPAMPLLVLYWQTNTDRMLGALAARAVRQIDSEAADRAGIK